MSTYEKLVKKFPLKPIKGQKMHQKALSILEKLIIDYDFEDVKNIDVVEYSNVLSMLIEDYENQLIKIEKSDPVENLKFLMSEHGYTQKALEDMGIMKQSILSEILGRKRGRQLNTSHIKKLSKLFNVSADCFLD